MDTVIDSNVLIHGKGSVPGSLYTVPSVIEELESSGSRLKFDSMDIEVMKPSDDSVEAVRKKAKEINAPTSNVDEKLVALTMDLDGELLTDDRAAQNLALHLDLDFSGYLDPPVENKRCWKKVCGNCGAEVTEECSFCGSSSIRLKPGPCS